MAEGAKTIRQARTIFGGAVTDARPLVTYTLIGLCLAIFAGQMVNSDVTNRLAFSPALGASEPWRFLTSGFVHSPGFFLHIAFNMYALWFMGQYLEPLLGRARFLATYLLSALGGSVAYLLLAAPLSLEQLAAGQRGAWVTSVVGASGAVFGLFAATVVLNRKLRRDSSGMLVTIGLNAVIGFVVPGIAWQAHLGGLVTGAACAAVIAYTGRPTANAVAAPSEGRSPGLSSRLTHWAGLAALLVLLVVLAIGKYALSASAYLA